MFTGLVHGDAHIAKIHQQGATIKMSVATSPDNLKQLKIGDSIAVNGCCLTVEEFDDDSFAVTMMPQTFKQTNFKQAQVGDQVNIERSLKANNTLDGHLVTGHIDATVAVLAKRQNENAIELVFALPERLNKQVVSQGSIAINGTSLTVMKADKDSFSVGLIPHTQAETNLDQLAVGDQVNIETDIIGKYVARNLEITQGE